MKKVCLQCGEEINPKTPWGKFCDNKCQGKYRRAHPNYPPCICKGCGIEFIPKANDRTTYHSRECAFKDKTINAKGKKPYHKRPFKIKTCVICGAEFKTQQTKSKYCSDECRRLASVKGSYDRKTAIPRDCKWCGSSFIPEYKANTYAYCCEEHKKLALKKAEKIHKGPISKAKRKRIYLRDGCTCKLCGKKMRMDKAETVGLGKPHPLAPTVDHIIPKSIAIKLGWTKQEINAESNLQAAHFYCNVKKGNRCVNEQLLLFG